MNVQQLDLFETLAESSPAKGYDFGGAKEYYEIYERDRAMKMFDAVFDMDIREFAYMCIGDYANRMIGAMLRRILIDPFRFDEALHDRHGDYETQGKCMSDVVLENYGKDGLDLFMALTNFARAK
jgi:hypothetical protein